MLRLSIRFQRKKFYRRVIVERITSSCFVASKLGKSFRVSRRRERSFPMKKYRRPGTSRKYMENSRRLRTTMHFRRENPRGCDIVIQSGQFFETTTPNRSKLWANALSAWSITPAASISGDGIEAGLTITTDTSRTVQLPVVRRHRFIIGTFIKHFQARI